MPSDMVQTKTMRELQGASSEALLALERSNRDNEFLLASSALLSEPGQHHTVILQRLAEFVSAYFGAVCNISVVHPGEEVIRPIALHHQDGQVEADIREAFSRYTVRVGEGLVGKVMAEGVPIVEFRADDELRMRVRAFSRRIVPESFMYIPMKAPQGVLGVINLVRLEGEEPFMQSEVDLTARLAGHTALFLDNAWLREAQAEELQQRMLAQEELERSNAVSAFLLSLSRLLTDVRADREKVLFGLTEMVATHFNVFCVVYLDSPEGGGLRPRAFYHADARVRVALMKVFWSDELENGMNAANYVSRKGVPLVRNFADSAEQATLRMESELTPQAYGFWPLNGYGAICLCRLQGTSSFTEDELERATQLAAHLSLFLDNMMLHDRQQLEIARREEAESRLARNEADLRGILNAIPINISRISRDMRYQFLNDAYRSWGMDPDRLVGSHLSDLLGEDQYTKVLPVLERVLSGQVVQYEDQLQLEGHGTFHFTAVLAPEFDSEGKVRGFLSCALDQTAKVMAERDLRLSEERYRSLLLHSGDAFCLHRFSGEILDVNDFAVEMFGYSREELLTMNINSIDHGWLTPEYPRRLNKVSPDTPVTFETILFHKDGSEIPVEVRFVKRVEDGEVLIQALVRDRTEKFRQEEKLRKSEEWLRLVFDHVNDIIMGLHWDGTVLSINRPQQGYAESDVVGRSIYHNMEEAVAQQLRENLEQARRTGEPFEMVMRHLGPDGTSEWYLTNYCPVESREMLICVSKKITHIKQSELQVMNGMTIGQEQERKRLGAELHDGVGQILSSIALDISELTQTAVCNDGVRKRLEEVGNRVTEAIREVRNISHDLMPGVLESFGLEDAIRQVCRNMRGRAGISIGFDSVDLAGNYPEAVETHLYRITQELINNCIRHAHCTRIHVNLIDHGDALTLSVEDDGIGFDPEHQTDGIGIRNIRSRISILGGTLSVESSSTSGTLVIVEVPNRQ